MSLNMSKVLNPLLPHRCMRQQRTLGQGLKTWYVHLSDSPRQCIATDKLGREAMLFTRGYSGLSVSAGTFSKYTECNLRH